MAVPATMDRRLIRGIVHPDVLSRSGRQAWLPLPAALAERIGSTFHVKHRGIVASVRRITIGRSLIGPEATVQLAQGEEPVTSSVASDYGMPVAVGVSGRRARAILLILCIPRSFHSDGLPFLG